MALEQEPSISDVLHAVDLLRRDVSQVDATVTKLVSMERYAAEHEAQQKDIARIEQQVSNLDKARETMRHMIMSSFLFPLAVALIFYLISSSSGGT